MVSTTTLSEQAVRERIDEAMDRMKALSYVLPRDDDLMREDTKIVHLFSCIKRHFEQRDWSKKEYLEELDLKTSALPFFQTTADVMARGGQAINADLVYRNEFYNVMKTEMFVTSRPSERFPVQ